jgi:hypothetical protein
VTSLADQVIAALRSGHDDLAGYAQGLAETALTGRSGASEWDVAQVLGHLGSGAEIGLARLEAALAGDGPPGPRSTSACGTGGTPCPRWSAGMVS